MLWFLRLTVMALVLNGVLVFIGSASPSNPYPIPVFTYQERLSPHETVRVIEARDVQTGQVWELYRSGGVGAVSISPHDPLIFFTPVDSAPRLLHLRTGETTTFYDYFANNWNIEDWSMDRAWAVGATNVVRLDGNRTTLLTVNLNTKQVTTMRTNKTNNFAPNVSAEGGKLIYYSDRDGGYSLYHTDTATDETTRLTAFGQVAYNPVWSPDETQVVFSSRSDGATHLMLLDLKTGEIAELLQDPAAVLGEVAAWSPDSRYIAYVLRGQSRHAVILIDTHNDNHISRVQDDIRIDTANLHWSADGRWLAFTALFARYEPRRHVIVNIHTRDVVQLDTDGMFLGFADGWLK